MAQGVWATNSLGGHLTNNKLSKQLRVQAGPTYTFRQFVKVKEGGENQGDTVYFVKRLRIDTRGTTYAETNTASKNTIKFTKGSCVVAQYMNSVNYTGKLEALADWNVENEYRDGLQEDMKDTFDRAVAAKFVLADFKAVCTSTSSTVFTTNGTATATAAASISDKNHRDIVDYMRKKQIPYFEGGREYISIHSTTSLRGIYDFLEAKDMYTKPTTELNYEEGKYYKCRMVSENNYLSDSLGSDTKYGEAVYFGNEAVMEVVAMAEEIRAEQISGSLGMDLLVGYVGLLGWTKIWDLGDDDLNSTGKGTERIIHVTSV